MTISVTILCAALAIANLLQLMERHWDKKNLAHLNEALRKRNHRIEKRAGKTEVGNEG